MHIASVHSSFATLTLELTYNLVWVMTIALLGLKVTVKVKG